MSNKHLISTKKAINITKNKTAIARHLNMKRKKSDRLNAHNVILISDSEDGETPKKKVKTQSVLQAATSAEMLTSDDDDEDILPNFKRKIVDTPSVIAVSKSDFSSVLISDDDDDDDIVPTNKKNLVNAKSANVSAKYGFTGMVISEDEDEDIKPSISKKENSSKEKISQINNDNCDDFLEGHKLPIKTEDIKVEWSEYELLAQQKDLKLNVAKNIFKLFNDGNTIPFIARYRRDATENMTPETLREVKDSIEEIVSLKQKIGTAIKTISKTGELNPQLEKSFKSVRSFEELEILYAPYKPGQKRTLAQRAKDLGLEQPALDILHNVKQANLEEYVEKSNKELCSVKDVEKGVGHVIAQVIATDSEMLTYLRQLRKTINVMLETKKLNSKQKPKKSTVAERKPDISKFENYFDFKIPVKYVKPHQILAINRGEHHKYLSVKIVFPDYVQSTFKNFCLNKWSSKGPNKDSNSEKILIDSINDAYTRLVLPLLIREIRSELKTMAEKASYEVFSKNLKQLLLAAPFKGQPILAIDPGYTAGCKIALVSQTGVLLAYNTIYPHKEKSSKFSYAEMLRTMLKQHNCSLIAIGNGTACRETEEWLTELIKKKYFLPLDIKYTIVNEDGASIYSCSAEAKKEFPELDTNIISAVSLARRIQDPLAELVKIEPQHLGVGMYQHDLKKKTLEEALSEVVSECVSFVGVDLNTASQCLLRRIAGLTDKRATQIIDYRERNGPFLYRKQLINVFGIGPKVFEQCAGFLRVGPTNAEEALNFYKQPKTTKLDSTIIHPESYETAERLMKKYNLKIGDIGEQHFIHKVKNLNIDPGMISTAFRVPEETIKLIIDALSKPINYDLRNEMSQVPLFRKGLTSIQDLKVNMTVTGQVRNVTHFGCFVDIGVGTDGLIHNSKLCGLQLQIGDRVEVKVERLEVEKKRIGLKAVMKL